MYAVRGKVRIGEMQRGGNSCNERPPNVLDTTPLAEGMDYQEWSEKETRRLKKVLGED